MNELATDQRTKIVRSAILAAVTLLLAAFVVWTIRNSSAEPLDPGDRMDQWRQASTAQRRATSELLVAQLRENGVLGPNTLASLKSQAGARGLADVLMLDLNDATDRNNRVYVSPSDTIERTVEKIAKSRGWDK